MKSGGAGGGQREGAARALPDLSPAPPGRPSLPGPTFVPKPASAAEGGPLHPERPPDSGPMAQPMALGLLSLLAGLGPALC